jgi:hypothetical protein
MSSKWIQLTSAASNHKIYINMIYATAVFAHEQGSRISFVGDADDHADVLEMPDAIMSVVADEQADPA